MPSSFLILRLGALGDIVHGLPLLAALRAAHPDARIDWLVDVRHRAVLELVSGLSRRLVVDTRRWRGDTGLARVVREMRLARYDLAIDLQGLLKSAALARLSRARRVLGFAAAHLREPAARFFYTELVDPGRRRHVVERSLVMAEAAGVRDARPVFPLVVPPSTIVERVRASLQLRDDEPYVVLNPGAAWPNKRWPADRFGRLAAHIRSRHGWRSAVTWGPGEEGIAAEVVRASGGAAAVAPSTTLPDLVALLASARLVVAGDTGPLHLAAALGRPVVGLFGPTDPARNGPWWPEDLVVSRSPQCHCFHQRRCRAAQWCLDTIDVAEVQAAIDRRLSLRS
ncbi:MAG TPA: lipopolysaccharide heptosyltransferase I [Vicinamibacterales bacterium]